MKVRTVVTGHDAKGRSVFVRDERVDGTPIPGLGELAFLWNADEPATYPNAGNNPAAPGIFPLSRLPSPSFVKRQQIGDVNQNGARWLTLQQA